jgi:hypothetical protein
MDWLDNIKKELEISNNHPIRKKKDWEIEREIRWKSMAKDAGEAAKKAHKKNKTGTLSFTDKQRSEWSSLGGKAGTKEQKSKAGKLGSSEDKSKAGSISSNKIHTCSYCGKSHKGNGFFRYHKNGKCLQKSKDDIHP